MPTIAKINDIPESTNATGIPLSKKMKIISKNMINIVSIYFFVKSLCITSAISKVANKYIDDFSKYTKGRPPASLEPSIIDHELNIIGVLTYITKIANGITKQMYPNELILLSIDFLSFDEKISIFTCASSLMHNDIPNRKIKACRYITISCRYIKFILNRYRERILNITIRNIT